MRVTADHWSLLLDFCELHPQIITNKFSGAFNGKEESQKLWLELTTKLNSLGFGEKSVEDWKKSLTDWKSKTKLKVSKFNQHQNKTGGGPASTKIITPHEERLINLMGRTAVEGNPTIKEIGIPSNRIPLQTVVNDMPTSNESIISCSKYANFDKGNPSQAFYVSSPIPNASNVSVFSSEIHANNPCPNTTFSSLPHWTAPTTQVLSETHATTPKRARPNTANMPNITASSNTRNTKQTTNKEDYLQDVKDINKEVIGVLNNINDNISLIAENFSKLIVLLENQSK